MTETEGRSDPVKLREAERTIAAVAKDRGTTDPDSLRQIAEDMGYELSGDVGVATIKQRGKMWGENDVVDKRTGRPIVSLTGRFCLKPKPERKTTRKESVPARGAAPASGGASSQNDQLLKKFGLE